MKFSKINRTHHVYTGLLDTGVDLDDTVKGPFDLTFSHLGECEKKGPYNLFQSMKFSKINRTHHIYTGLLDTGVDLDETVKVRMVASNKGTNGRYNNVVDIQYKVCELLRTFGMAIVNSICEHCNHTFECPCKRFTCEMNKWVFVYDFEKVPALPYGEYRLDVIAFKLSKRLKKEMISCTRFYGVATPKRPKSPKYKNNTVPKDIQ
ncbi:uncharacterized protein LOC120350978 isoform X2 [Nilaparvata lugens]|nr:uncharacterized protein LOC120350978 isoform X2 [Nilaparvata lugens]